MPRCGWANSPFAHLLAQAFVQPGTGDPGRRPNGMDVAICRSLLTSNSPTFVLLPPKLAVIGCHRSPALPLYYTKLHTTIGPVPMTIGNYCVWHLSSETTGILKWSYLESAFLRIRLSVSQIEKYPGGGHDIFVESVVAVTVIFGKVPAISLGQRLMEGWYSSLRLNSTCADPWP